ncbi:MAG: phosphate ABC transporter permease PstA [Bdellovibrionales bacterium]
MKRLSFQDWQRRWRNNGARLMLLLLSLAAVLPFGFIVWHVLREGAGAINWAFFTQLPRGPGDAGGGMANAILGSVVMVMMSSVIGIPWGMAAGIYLSEYGQGRTATILRFTVDLLTSVPSIIVGIFIYGVVVVRFGFSAYAGALALSVIMLPIVARSTEEILKLMPIHIREAGLALGLPRWKVILKLVVPGSRTALLTGVMLAVARVFGETAPLLFTALGNQYFSRSLAQPTATMPVQIYNLAKSGFPDQEQQAWAGALVLVVLVITINLITRLVLSRKET